MSRTFSESWHRVANARLSLLPSVVVNKQCFRGQPWYVLRDTYTQRFFRVTPQAYAFVARLHPSRTVEQVWQICLQQQPDEAPGQEEVIQVLAQLHQSNLLFHDTSPDSQTIFCATATSGGAKCKASCWAFCRFGCRCGTQMLGWIGTAVSPVPW